MCSHPCLEAVKKKKFYLHLQVVHLVGHLHLASVAARVTKVKVRVKVRVELLSMSSPLQAQRVILKPAPHKVLSSVAQ